MTIYDLGCFGNDTKNGGDPKERKPDPLCRIRLY